MIERATLSSGRLAVVVALLAPFAIGQLAGRLGDTTDPIVEAFTHLLPTTFLIALLAGVLWLNSRMPQATWRAATPERPT